MKVALSPCPNDTYLFHAWIEGFVGQDIPAEAVFADIQKLNENALAESFPLIKLSFHCLSRLWHAYQLLPVGSALGNHCGPKIISKMPFSLEELPTKKIAVPGEGTTAHLLLERLLPSPKEKIFCLYHEIASLVDQGVADCGVIIHESRFTFQAAGFVEIADLGEIWYEETLAPLPLGGLAISRKLPDSTKKRVVAILRESLHYAQTNPKSGLPFILHHSQEKEEMCVRKHIDTYVTQETHQLSTIGIKAIETLLDCGPLGDRLYAG